MTAFERFAAIDWSGAKGKRHKGIAIAICEAKGGAPRLVRPDHVWSRTEVLDWLVAAAAEAPTLFGFDFSFAPPIADRGEYLPGEPRVPASARELWAYVDAKCDDEDLGAASFLELAHRRHFYFGIADGVNGPLLLLARAAGIPVDVPPLGTYTRGLYMTRFDESFMLSDAERATVALADGGLPRPAPHRDPRPPLAGAVAEAPR